MEKTWEVPAGTGEVRTVKAGTMVHIGGIPFTLAADAELKTHENNWSIAFELFERDADTAGSA